MIFLSRFDLESNKQLVRSLNLDCGPSFRVLSDDTSVLPRSAGDEERQLVAKLAEEAFGRYAELLSAAAALVYIPLVFADSARSVVDTSFATELQAPRHEDRVREAREKLRVSEIPSERAVRCLVPRQDDRPVDTRRLSAPPITQIAEGYWRSLPPGGIGEDKEGKPVVGRTWVRRVEAWSSDTASSFLLSRTKSHETGPHPGAVYIARSPSLGAGIYKVGSTTRDPDIRATELGSTTGVPLPFEILASWDVGDCNAVEKEVHRRLEPYRISSRREFFFVGLSEIVSAIEEVIRDIGGTRS